MIAYRTLFAKKLYGTSLFAQLCAATVAEILPPEVVIRVLKPLVQMGDFPVNQSAIKMLNKLVEAHPPPVVAQVLGDVMPGLVKVRNRPTTVIKLSKAGHRRSLSTAFITVSQLRLPVPHYVVPDCASTHGRAPLRSSMLYYTYLNKLRKAV